MSPTDEHEALDWTAFQMAISGTMEDMNPGDSIWEEDQKELDDIMAWYSDFGFRSIGGLVREGPRKKPHRKEKEKKHSKSSSSSSSGRASLKKTHSHSRDESGVRIGEQSSSSAARKSHHHRDDSNVRPPRVPSYSQKEVYIPPPLPMFIEEPKYRKTMMPTTTSPSKVGLGIDTWSSSSPSSDSNKMLGERVIQVISPSPKEPELPKLEKPRHKNNHIAEFIRSPPSHSHGGGKVPRTPPTPPPEDEKEVVVIMDEGRSSSSGSSLPPSPMLKLVASPVMDEMIPMGYNLGHDLGDFLNWETYHVTNTYSD
jgi:hypothetical protein